MFSPIESDLFSVLDTESVDCVIAYEPAEGEVLLGYSWNISPELLGRVSVALNDEGVRVFSDQLIELFEPDFIDYFDSGEVFRASGFSDLPPCKELIKFKPSSISQRDYSIEVCARVEVVDVLTGLVSEAEVTGSWNMIVFHDYSSGREQMLEYMKCLQ